MLSYPRSAETVVFAPGGIQQDQPSTTGIATADPKAASDALARLWAAG